MKYRITDKNLDLRINTEKKILTYRCDEHFVKETNTRVLGIKFGKDKCDCKNEFSILEFMFIRNPTYTIHFWINGCKYNKKWEKIIKENKRS